MILIDRCALRYFKRRRPHPKGQAVVTHHVSNIAKSAREQIYVGRRVFAACVLVSLIDLVIVIPKLPQVFCQPLRICNCGSLVESEVIGSPTPPPHWARSINSSFMQQPDRAAILLQL